MATIVIGLIIAALAVLAIRHQLKVRKSGGCGCGCTGCAQSGQCGGSEQE